MIIGLLSDTHGRVAHLEKALGLLKGVDLLVHLGDGAEDLDKVQTPILCPLLQLRGNCDFFADYPETVVREISGAPCLFTHGHRFQVKAGLASLAQAAREKGFRLACYGHTHIPRVDTEHGILLVNPGSLYANPTCAKVTITPDGTIRPQILRVQ